MGRGDGWGTNELALLEALLRSMLAYEPAKRITSAAAQGETWMVEYGLPAINKGAKRRH